jgi:hypothetical protein
MDDEDELNARDEERERKRAEKEEAKSLTKEEKQALSAAEKARKKKERDDRRDKRRLARQEKIKLYRKLFDDMIENIKQQALKMLDEIKQAALDLWTELVDVTRKIVVLTGILATSIVAITGMIVLPPWNIPEAVKSTLEVVSVYLSILRQIKKIIPFLLPFKLLPMVVDPSKLSVVATVFNQFISLLRTYWVPIKLLNQLIVDLLRKIADFLEKNLNNVFKKATRKLKKLGHLYRFDILNLPPDFRRGDFYDANEAEGRKYSCFSYDPDDVEEIQGLLDQFIIGNEGDKVTNRVIAYRAKLDQVPDEFARGKDFSDIDLRALADELENPDIPEINTDDIEIEDRFIYDIELPDGTIVKNITEEGIDFYRENYILRYMNAFTQSIQAAAQTI